MGGIKTHTLFLLAVLCVPLISAPVVSLTARDLGDGKTRTVRFDEGQVQGTVLVFLSSECPCSESHEKPLAELAKNNPKFQFFGILANADEDRSSAKKHFEKASLPFPILDDFDQSLANRWGALRTPHAFILDRKGELIYHGGMDDSHDAARARKHYLAIALDAIVGARKPDPAETRALGCMIAR